MLLGGQSVHLSRLTRWTIRAFVLASSWISARLTSDLQIRGCIRTRESFGTWSTANRLLQGELSRLTFNWCSIGLRTSKPRRAWSTTGPSRWYIKKNGFKNLWMTITASIIVPCFYTYWQCFKSDTWFTQWHFKTKFLNQIFVYSCQLRTMIQINLSRIPKHGENTFLFFSFIYFAHLRNKSLVCNRVARHCLFSGTFCQPNIRCI